MIFQIDIALSVPEKVNRIKAVIIAIAVQILRDLGDHVLDHGFAVCKRCCILEQILVDLVGVLENFCDFDHSKSLRKLLSGLFL